MLHNYKVMGLNEKSAFLFKNKMDKIRENPYSKLFYRSCSSVYLDYLFDFDILCSEQIWHDLNYFLVVNCYYFDFYCNDSELEYRDC